ncbi:MAG: 50S ribosomal protein L11 methyltransferase [Deltaproteobacteria bacterium]|nr:50S ribosomal protein L11 methyltransferase [Deltaproteobacteria bacterium]
MTVPVKTTQKPNKDNGTLRRKVLGIVEESSRRLTPGELRKRLSAKKIVDKKALKTAILDLVLSRELKYTYHLGCSFLEKSYEKPIRVSRRVVLKPPGMVYEPAPDDIVIDILKGASFGFGDHPTTRLAIQGIEAALSENHGILKADNSRALDIGTGSGILAIAAVSIGIKRAVGIDIDPCARDEAQKNIKLNGLEHRINILDTSVEDIKETYSLITANLRYPTLKRLCSHIAGMMQEKGAVVVSGIKSDEVEDLLGNFTQNGFRCTWKAVEKGWAGMVLISL